MRLVLAAALLLAAARIALGGPAQAAPLTPAASSLAGAQGEVPRDPRVDRILTLENERLALMPAVAAWKWQHHAAVMDTGREGAIIADTARLARPLGLEVAPVEGLFRLQMRLARGVEDDLHREWRRQGFHFAGPVPDLARDLRPRLDRLTGALLRALRAAEPALSRPSFPAWYAADAAQRLNARGWTPQTRRELLVALSAIRLAPRPPRRLRQPAG